MCPSRYFMTCWRLFYLCFLLNGFLSLQLSSENERILWLLCVCLVWFSPVLPSILKRQMIEREREKWEWVQSSPGCLGGTQWPGRSERGGFSWARPCTVIYFAYGVLADTILNFQLGGISGGITVFKRRPASHAPPVARDLSVRW